MNVITIITPTNAPRFSGGSLYNQRVADASKGRIKLISTSPDSLFDIVANIEGPAIIDSLFFLSRGDAVQRLLTRRRPSGAFILAHSLPVREEDRSLLAHGFSRAIVPSQFLAAEIGRCGMPQRNVAVAVPGVSLEFVSSSTTRPGPAAAGPHAYRKSTLGGSHAPAPAPFQDGVSAHRPAEDGRDIVLLTVSNFEPGKRHAWLLSVLELLDNAGARSAVDFRWDIVGGVGLDSTCYEEFLRVLDTSSIRERVVVHGLMPPASVASYMRSADLLLHPSLFETYGMVLAEAAATGLPAIAVRAGGTSEVVVDGITGCLLDPEDRAAWISTLSEMIGNSQVRERMRASCGLREVRRWDQTADDIVFASKTPPGS